MGIRLNLAMILAFTCLGIGLGWSTTSTAEAAPTTITLLHTNDLHSHFRPSRNGLGLGGIARIKSFVNQTRKNNPNTLLVDGGDWSEGNIYYLAGAGTETLRMMDEVGYDVAVVGNHDFLNGPDVLLDAISQARLKNMSVIAANISPANYSRKTELEQQILPYVIRQVGGVKMAFIGLTTSELIYDRYFKPVQIEVPFKLVAALAQRLRSQVDFVTVISHNNLKMNKKILDTVPEVDLIIGAHDHVKLTHPVEVVRSNGKKAWMVETGCWGHYVGQIQIQVDSSGSQLNSYQLVAMDSSIADDRSINSRLEGLEKLLEGQMSRPIFHDHAGDSDLEITRDGSNAPRGSLETLMGNFTTDSYRDHAQTDIAIDQSEFIYGDLPQGLIRSVDVFNSNPGVYSPQTKKSWTLHTLNISGKTLEWLLGFLIQMQNSAKLGMLSVSGMQLMVQSAAEPPSLSGAQKRFSEFLIRPDFKLASDCQNCQISIGGKALDPDRQYSLAVSGGAMDTIEFINGYFPGAIPLNSLRDSNEESWRVLEERVRVMSPLRPGKIELGRVRMSTPDLGIRPDGLLSQIKKIRSSGTTAHVTVVVQNFGLADFNGSAQLTLRTQRNVNQSGADPIWDTLASGSKITHLAAGDTQAFEFDVTVPVALGMSSISAALSNTNDPNRSNDELNLFVPVNKTTIKRARSGTF